MTPEELSEFEELLLNAQADIMGVADILEHSSGVVDLDQSKVGRLSRMDAMQAQNMAMASQQRNEEYLEAISSALARIDEGSYGLCFGCDQAIPLARLRIAPESEYCVACIEAGKS